MTSTRELRDALRAKTGTKVAAACKHVAARPELADELAPAFARLTEQGAKRDPGCHGKLAIARTLHDLERWEDDVFAAGVRLVQLQPALGGPADAAAELRGVCGLAYAHFMRSDALDVLAELLADAERGARLGAARALGDSGRHDAGPLLRFKLLAGDEAPEVVSAVIESLLHVDASSTALGGRRDARAFEPLLAWCKACMAEQRRRVGYVALALLRDERATAFLKDVARDGDEADIAAATKALAIFD